MLTLTVLIQQVLKTLREESPTRGSLAAGGASMVGNLGKLHDVGNSEFTFKDPHAARVLTEMLPLQVRPSKPRASKRESLFSNPVEPPEDEEEVATHSTVKLAPSEIWMSCLHLTSAAERRSIHRSSSTYLAQCHQRVASKDMYDRNLMSNILYERHPRRSLNLSDGSPSRSAGTSIKRRMSNP